MSRKVTIIDYGVGNLFSVARALEKVGAEPVFSSDADEILAADRVILPGVGAFAAVISELKATGLDEVVKAFAATSRPLLAICVGMQMLFDASEEFGVHEGLGLLPGRVTGIAGLVSHPVRVPHIGWSGLFKPEGADWRNTPLAATLEGAGVYFVHSFAAVPKNEHLLASVLYGGTQITAAVRKDNVFGVQFHPEKSGPVGLGLLEQFVAA